MGKASKSPRTQSLGRWYASQINMIISSSRCYRNIEVEQQVSSYGVSAIMGDRKRSTTSCLIVGGGISGERGTFIPQCSISQPRADDAIQGICMAIDLIRRNKCQDFIIVEKGNSFGGTWNDNTYPGIPP